LKVSQRVAGYAVYDSQLDHIIDLKSDQKQVIKLYSRVVDEIE
jgi:hypothetical protein